MSVFLGLLAKFSALCVALSVHEWAHAFIAYLYMERANDAIFISYSEEDVVK